MKTIFITLSLLAVFCGCASADPPLHKQRTLYVTVPPGATGVNFYVANHADTNYTFLKTVVAGAGQQASADLPAVTPDLGTADATNATTSAASDYATPWTNNIITTPTVTGK